MSYRPGCGLALLLFATRLAGAAPPVTPGNAVQSRIAVDRYCVTCHNDRLRTAGLTLEKTDFTNIPGDAEKWENVIAKLRGNSMPPAGLPRPDDASRKALIGWLESSIDRAAAANPKPGRTVLHRLNRAEYGNAVRDLLGMETGAATLLPPDDSGFGFDNIADVLSVSPMLTERYLAAARKISRAAVGDVAIRPVTESYAPDKLFKQDDRASEDLPFASRAGIAVPVYFPVDGDYFVKIFLQRTNVGLIRGPASPYELQVRLNGELVRQATVGTSTGGTKTVPGRRRVDTPLEELDGLEVRFSAKAGPGVLAVTFARDAHLPEGMLRPIYSITSYEFSGDVAVPPGITNIELRGPYDVRGPGNSPSRQRIFSCHPASAHEEEACSRQILSTLARRAYRRPVTSGDLQPLLAFYATGRSKGSFDSGIEMALQRILVSPDFLFRIERDPATRAAGVPYRVTDLELASRLSFFLWSSIPDDELLDAAIRGTLRQPGVLEHQVTRMLSDVRSRSFVANFTGQWLYVRNVPLVLPDPYAFPDFDDNLRQAFSRELELFLDSQIRQDHSALDLLTADYTYVNAALARHYGIPNVYGTHFRRVQLTDSNRYGLLGKAGILMVTSYANRTSPVKRGKWLLENIIGAPPPPPPPNVPSLKENAVGESAHSVRERMEEHRANPACAGCHRTMDPLGFALENFDAIGSWRATDEAGAPVDASGELIDGTHVDGPESLRRALLNHQEDFARTVTDKLLTYALGRGTEYYDAPAVRRIVRDSAADNSRWSSIILGIVRSAPFQMRM
jgi:hypothetical protein